MRIHPDKPWALREYQFALLYDRHRYRAGEDYREYQHKRRWHLARCQSVRDLQQWKARFVEQMQSARTFKRLWCWFAEHDYFEAVQGMVICRRCKHLERFR